MTENVDLFNTTAAKTMDILEPTAVYPRYAQTVLVLMTAESMNPTFDYVHYARETTV
jgi:hypothetical protein